MDDRRPDHSLRIVGGEEEELQKKLTIQIFLKPKYQVHDIKPIVNDICKAVIKNGLENEFNRDIHGTKNRKKYLIGNAQVANEHENFLPSMELIANMLNFLKVMNQDKGDYVQLDKKTIRMLIGKMEQVAWPKEELS